MSKHKSELFHELESSVRSYCRSYPNIFVKAQGARLWDESGRDYIDFLSGAGALNYGHNNPALKKKLVEYLLADGITHSLDLHTAAKHDFLKKLQEVILEPRALSYKVAFTGPTGTNAVEAALKFARRSTGRETVIAFTNAYHGMTQGSLAASGTRSKRAGAGMPLGGVTRVPFEGYLGDDLDTADLLERLLEDPGSGVDLPAAVILETVQAEGGLNVASSAWLRRIESICARHGIVLIVDDVQAGCGRTGRFFSFEESGIKPDIVCLSKSLGGMGMPLAVVLLKPELDVLTPGQHNGTFRGNNLAFVAGGAALDLWREKAFETRIQAIASSVRTRLDELVRRYPEYGAHVRGRGLLIGIGWSDATVAGRVSKEAYARGLIIETSGARNEVLKLLPPLTISPAELKAGLAVLDAALAAVLGTRSSLGVLAEEVASNAAV